MSESRILNLLAINAQDSEQRDHNTPDSPSRGLILMGTCFLLAFISYWLLRYSQNTHPQPNKHFAPEHKFFSHTQPTAFEEKKIAPHVTRSL